MNDWIFIASMVGIVGVLIAVMWMGNDYDEW